MAILIMTSTRVFPTDQAASRRSSGAALLRLVVAVLRISSKLLRLATLVEDQPREED